MVGGRQKTPAHLHHKPISHQYNGKDWAAGTTDAFFYVILKLNNPQIFFSPFFWPLSEKESPELDCT